MTAWRNHCSHRKSTHLPTDYTVMYRNHTSLTFIFYFTGKQSALLQQSCLNWDLMLLRTKTHVMTLTWGHADFWTVKRKKDLIWLAERLWGLRKPVQLKKKTYCWTDLNFQFVSPGHKLLAISFWLTACGKPLLIILLQSNLFIGRPLIRKHFLIYLNSLAYCSRVEYSSFCIECKYLIMAQWMSLGDCCSGCSSVDMQYKHSPNNTAWLFHCTLSDDIEPEFVLK